MLNIRPKSVRIVEVGPRDGLQNEKKIVSTANKLLFIEKLLAAGLNNIEVTSFVSTKKIPQMGDASELFKAVTLYRQQGNFSFPCLVPNLQGLDKALEVGVREIALFTSTSNTFNLKNINVDIEESFKRMQPVVRKARQHQLFIRAYISTAFGCPYEGKISIEQLKTVAQRMLQLGVDEISLGDTIGVAHPLQVQELLQALKQDFDFAKLALHFHDTRGLAVANCLAALDMGIEIFDASAGGLGGCPYAHGATGNVATEDLVYLLKSMGIDTGVDLEKLCEASTFILKAIGRESSSKYLRSYQAVKCAAG